MAESKNLKTAVDAEVKQAETKVQTGNEQTIKQGPDTLKEASKEPVDLPTHARSHQNP